MIYGVPIRPGNKPGISIESSITENRLGCEFMAVGAYVPARMISLMISSGTSLLEKLRTDLRP